MSTSVVILFVFIANIRSVQLFYDDAGSFLQFSPSSASFVWIQEDCASDKCILIHGGHMITSPSISAVNYKNITLEFSIKGQFLEKRYNDACQVFYCFDGINWILLQQYTITSWKLNEIKYLPSTADNCSDIQIRFAVTEEHQNKEDNDYCYIDEVYIFGTRITLNPTSNPTSNPTAHPSLNPALNPTLNPTSNPTETASDNGVQIDIIFEYNTTSDITSDEIEVYLTNITNEIIDETIDLSNNDQCYDVNDPNVSVHNNTAEIQFIIDVCNTDQTSMLIAYLEQSSLERDFIEKIILVNIVNGSIKITITDINQNETDVQDDGYENTSDIHKHHIQSWLFYLLFVICGVLICCICVLCVVAVRKCKEFKKNNKMIESMSGQQKRHIRLDSCSQFEMNGIQSEDIVTQGNDLVLLYHNKAYETPRPPPRRNKNNVPGIQLNEINHDSAPKVAINVDSDQDDDNGK